jgi:hypothetical protein
MGFTMGRTNYLPLFKSHGVAHDSRKTSPPASTTRRAADFKIILFYFPKQSVAQVTPLTRRATNFRAMKGS